MSIVRGHRWKVRLGALGSALGLAVVAHLPSAPLDLPHDGPDLPTIDQVRADLRGDPPAQRASQTWPQLDPQCPEPPRQQPRTSVRELNSFVSSMDLRYGQAGDIGASGALGDGRLVFVFGDTLRAPDVTPNIVANSMLVLSGRCVSQLLTREHGPIIPDRSDGVVHWPTTLAVLRGKTQDRIVVFTSRIRRVGGGALSFTYLGSSTSFFTVPHGGVPRRTRTVDLTPDDEDFQQINWGGAAVVSGRWLYVYGTQQAGTGRTLYVGRAPVDGLVDRQRWRFWDGTTWSPDAGSAVPVLAKGDPGVSQALSADVVDGRFVLVSKEGGDLGNRISSWTASSPTGPWTIHHGPSARFTDADGNLAYAPLAHPEIPLTDGKLLVGVSRNPKELGDLVADSRLGRPWFTEIDRPG